MMGVEGGNPSLMIGEASFDLSSFTQTNTENKQLKLTRVKDPDSFSLSPDDYIEIVVKTKVLEESETPSSTLNR